MKTAEEILSPLESKGEIFDRKKVLWLMALAMSERESEVKAQLSQQPTEKTREGAIELARKTWDESTLQVVDNVLEEIIDALIQSGYIQGKGINLEPYSQTENTNTPTLQSDSVDVELKSFLGFIAKERDAFVTEFLSIPTTTKRRVMAENLLIAYDQMKERLAGSKVKPVNEKMREGYPKINFIAYEPEYALELYKQWLNGQKV